MLKLLGNIFAKITDRDRGPCGEDWIRPSCGNCDHINRWMPKVTSFAEERESRMAVLVRSMLEIDEETLCAICNPCFHVFPPVGEDLDFFDTLEGDCLCIFGTRLGFPCDVCLPTPIFSLCGGKRYTYTDCATGDIKSYVFNSEATSACTIECDGNPEQYVFDIQNDPTFYRNILKAFFYSKTASGTTDTVITALSLMFPADTISVVDISFGRAWFSLGRPLTDLERRLRPILRSVLPIAPGVSFRILEPEC